MTVKREVYSGRVAEAAGISLDAMKLEVNKAFMRRISRDKKRQEQIALSPAKAMQPKERSIRYDNVKSAMAEEAVLALILREPALLEQAGNLHAEAFSVGLLGRVYDQLRQRYAQGMEVSIGVLTDLSAEETAHVTGILQRQQGPVNETAFRDCVRIILSEQQKKQVASNEDLLALRNTFKESKGTKA